MHHVEFHSSVSDPQRHQTLRRTNVFQTYSNNKLLTWAFCIFRGGLSQRRLWQEVAALCPSRVAQHTESQGLFALQRLSVSMGALTVWPCGAYHSMNREQMEAEQPTRLLQLWIYKGPKRKPWQLLSPRDLPKPQAPPRDLGRGAQLVVLTPLVIPRSLCAKLGRKSFHFCSLFFVTQPVLCSTSAFFPFSSALDFTYVLLQPDRKHQSVLVSSWDGVQGQFLFITHVPQPNDQDSFDLKHRLWTQQFLLQITIWEVLWVT